MLEFSKTRGFLKVGLYFILCDKHEASGTRDRGLWLSYVDDKE